MILLTRIDGTEFYLNPDLIETIEAAHDTHITLTTDHKYVCSEAPAMIVDRIAAFRRKSLVPVAAE